MSPFRSRGRNRRARRPDFGQIALPKQAAIDNGRRLDSSSCQSGRTSRRQTPLIDTATSKCLSQPPSPKRRKGQRRDGRFSRKYPRRIVKSEERKKKFFPPQLCCTSTFCLNNNNRHFPPVYSLLRLMMMHGEEFRLPFALKTRRGRSEKDIYYCPSPLLQSFNAELSDID